MLNAIPKIDVYSFTRSQLKVLKVKGSLGGQAAALVDKSNHIASATRGNNLSGNNDVTLATSVTKKLNII